MVNEAFGVSFSKCELLDFGYGSEACANGIKSENSEQEDSLLESSRSLVVELFGGESNHVDKSKLPIINRLLLKSLKEANSALQKAIRNDRDCRFSLLRAEHGLKEASAEVEAIMAYIKKD